MPHLSTPTDRHDALAWSAILGFVAFTALGILAQAGGLMRLLFPAGAFLVAVFLYPRAPQLYLGFAWWIAFLSPFVRRLIDQHSGWVDPSPVLLAPFLVLMVTALAFVRTLPRLSRQGGLPFILAIVAVVYAVLVGVIKQSPTAVIVPLLNWLTPILFGCYVFIHWRNYPRYAQTFQRVFLWCVLITGTYGILQYLIAPEWDRFWLINTKALAFGTAEPLGMRVFSTMNSPGPFATVMMAGLLLLFSNRSQWRFAAVSVGYLSFLLSLVRSAWLGWAVGLVAFIPTLKPKLQMRLVVSMLIMAICVMPLIALEPFASVINSRFTSLTDVSGGDVSYNDRLAGYTDFIGQALSQIAGEGFGFTLAHDAFGSNDSGILSIFFTFGWFGAIPYLGSIFLLFITLFRSSEGRSDPFIAAARAISLGVFAQIGLGIATAALSGVIMWSFAGMALAGQKYYSYQRSQQYIELETLPGKALA
ncbi:O-antigen ligase domain-containing protein [Pantanalinema rosaneae CENA516]|uniref:O-antigen ligase domain-containing protein n=1 Tax=Pantanalinema rosaneae TaxID=1620701 RepID=UPI003D6E899E